MGTVMSPVCVPFRSEPFDRVAPCCDQLVLFLPDSSIYCMHFYDTPMPFIPLAMTGELGPTDFLGDRRVNGNA